MSNITSSSTAEYFAKNLQQVGFSSPTKAVLTTLKESVDNALDACEESHILPELIVQVTRKGSATVVSKQNTDLVEISVEDNGPGIALSDLPKVFGEYLASSKFGRGRCSRGQQGIGISAATTWAQLTNASGVNIISKTKNMEKAVSAKINVNIKKNKGIFKNKTTVDWDKAHGLKVVFCIDGRVQLNGDGGLITYLEGTALVNPHLSLSYKLLDRDWRKIEKVTSVVPKVPPATLPHPHTMKLGEFISHAHLYGKITFEAFFKKGFSQINSSIISDFVKHGLKKSLLNKTMNTLSEREYKKIFHSIQETDMPRPSTRSVLTVGEEALSQAIQRMGEVDFFSVITRRPKICDNKPVVVETAVARLLDRNKEGGEEQLIQLMRFANRVPLQFDKSACAITKAVESVNWRTYGLSQQKNSLPQGPYVFAVAVTSPFIKFKNASKETIDASEELVEEIRRTLMQTGQKLSRHIKREKKADELKRKTQYIKQFVPVLLEKLKDITKANKKRVAKAEKGIMKILSHDTEQMAKALKKAETHLEELKKTLHRPFVSEKIEELEKKESEDINGLKQKKQKNVLTKKEKVEKPKTKKFKRKVKGKKKKGA